MKNINFKGIKRILKKGKIILLPVVLASTILTGCSSINSDVKRLKSNGLIIEKKDIEDNEPMYIIENNYASFYNTDNFKDIIPYSVFSNIEYEKTCTVLEFSDYMNMHDITYNDVRDSLMSNTNIDNDIKEILLEGINNLEKNNFNIDLSVLNYNIKNLNVIYEKKGREGFYSLSAIYVANENTVYVNPERKKDKNFKSLIIHEILGHASNIAYIKETNTYCTSSVTTLITKEGKVEGFNFLGKSFIEALAEYITVCATNELLDKEKTDYDIPLFCFLLMCKTNNITPEDYINNDVLYLIDKMQENGMGNVTDIIEKIDFKYNYITLQGQNTEYEFNDILVEYLKSYVQSLKDKGYSKEQTSELVDEAINMYKNYVIPLNIQNVNVFAVASSYENISYIIIDVLEDDMDKYIDSVFDTGKRKNYTSK